MRLPDHTDAELWALYTETKSPDVRNEIVTRHMGLAQYVGNRYRARAPEHQSIEDIISYAYEGLIDSVEKFKPEMGFQFPTYAVRRISGAILDGLRKEDPLPRSARKRVKDYEITYAWLFEMEGIEPSDNLLATTLGITEGELGHIQRDSQSQHQFFGDQEAPIKMDTHYDDPATYSEVAEICDHISHKISRMSETERNFILCHYGAGLTLAELADMLGVSESRLAQLRRSIVEAVTGGTH